jgi:5'-nucleotidase
LSSKIRPLILITNDDGIASPGLLAAVRCVLDLGEVWVVAPRVQQSGSGRSFPVLRVEVGTPYPLLGVEESTLTVDGTSIPALALNTSPAPTVRHGLLRFVPRRPDLVIAGINYGENIGNTITVSGTVGAAIEAASFGIPTLAASLETDSKYHFGQSTEIDFGTAATFVRRFAHWLLASGMPPGVDILKLDVPAVATPDTPWRITRVSRQAYWVSPVEVDEQGKKHLRGYVRQVDRETLEPDSDVYAIAIDGVVSVSPLTIDLTANVNLCQLQDTLSAELKTRVADPL